VRIFADINLDCLASLLSMLRAFLLLGDYVNHLKFLVQARTTMTHGPCSANSDVILHTPHALYTTLLE
jgi:hypothetical protein